MGKILRRIKIFELSAVDIPAQQGAVARIFKRDKGHTSMSTQATIEQTGHLADTLLEIKTNEILARQPGLSREQAYSKAYSDPANRELRVAEKRRPADRSDCSSIGRHRREPVDRQA
jgi:hypothetical protein